MAAIFRSHCYSPVTPLAQAVHDTLRTHDQSILYANALVERCHAVDDAVATLAVVIMSHFPGVHDDICRCEAGADYISICLSGTVHSLSTDLRSLVEHAVVPHWGFTYLKFKRIQNQIKMLLDRVRDVAMRLSSEINRYEDFLSALIRPPQRPLGAIWISYGGGEVMFHAFHSSVPLASVVQNLNDINPAI